MTRRLARATAAALAVIGALATVCAVQVAGIDPASAACQAPPLAGKPLPATAPRDPLLSRLDLDGAWQFTTGAGIVVGVVDSGVNAKHPKLAGAVDSGETVNQPQDEKKKLTVTPGGREDCVGHGTAVAGIIAGRLSADDDRVSGIAPAATIWPARIDGISADGTISQSSASIARAIKDAANHCHVLNLSFTAPPDDGIRDAIAYAVRRGVVVVAAAGNENNGADSTAPTYPAAYPGVLAVAAVGADGAPIAQSNGGPWIDIAAPGSPLTAPGPGPKGYATVSGTSFATAVVSGVAALVLAHSPTLTAAQVEARITATASPPASGRHDNRLGAGIVDPYAALTYDAHGMPTDAGGTTGKGAGSVAVVPPPAPPAAADPLLHKALRWSGIALIGALIIAAAGLATRAGIRRRWLPGQPPAAPTLSHRPSDIDLT